MSGDCENSKELDFKYESDASSSFLVIGCGARIIDFQARMLENNTIGYIVPVEAVKVEGTYHLYYNITSGISLSLYLKRHRLSRVEFLKLLLNLSSCINNSSGYLLSASNFIFDPEYLYIEPDTMEVRLVYIPADIGGNTGGTLQTLVSDLLMQYIHEEEFCSGNLVQRILSEVRSEVFNIKRFMILLNELLYGKEADVSPVQLPEKDFCDKELENSSKNDKIEENKEDKENKSQKISLSLITPMILIQFVMGAVIFMCRGFLDNVGKNRTTTYAAVVMIIIAIDVLLLRKLQTLKLFGVKSCDVTREAARKDTPEPVGDKAEKPIGTMMQNPARKRPEPIEPLAVKASGEVAALAESNKSTVQEVISSRYMQKTEILGSHVKGPHVLKCKGRLSGDNDIVISKDEFIIGRLQGHVDHVLLNNAVGKLHAELICRNGTCYLKDLNSINGTFINDMRIESNKEVELKNYDSVQFANSEFVFVCGGL